MATIAIGDLHGNLPALLDLLEKLQSEAGRGDVVVFLGDYIDRGADARGCIDAILAFRRESRADVICLLGNHEDWLLQTQADYTRHSWLLGMEALDTVRSYSPAAEGALRKALGEAGLELYLGDRVQLPYGAFFDAIPAPHREFFDGLVDHFEGPDCICVHGGLNPLVEGVTDQARESLIWGCSGFPSEYRGDRTVVYGHWNNAVVDARGWPGPRIVGNTIGIDTIAHGVLTAIRMPERRVFQSRRHAAPSVV